MPRTHATSVASAPGPAYLDEDGVKELYPAAPGSSFHLGTGDPNGTPGFVIEKNERATHPAKAP